MDMAAQQGVAIPNPNREADAPQHGQIHNVIADEAGLLIL
jgi:hypothetical protein